MKLILTFNLKAKKILQQEAQYGIAKLWHCDLQYCDCIISCGLPKSSTPHYDLKQEAETLKICRAEGPLTQFLSMCEMHL